MINMDKDRKENAMKIDYTNPKNINVLGYRAAVTFHLSLVIIKYYFFLILVKCAVHTSSWEYSRMRTKLTPITDV